MSKPMRLSPSKWLSYQDCAYKYHLRYGLRIYPEIESANLQFGSAIHAAIEAHLTALFHGTWIDPVEAFGQEWEEALKRPMSFNASTTSAQLTETGKVLMQRFPEAWDRTGLVPLELPGNRPALELGLKEMINDAIVIDCKIDFIGRDVDGNIVVLDFKTPASRSSKDQAHAKVSQQLLIYQYVADRLLGRIGQDPVHQVGFMNLIKTKVPKTLKEDNGPTVEAPKLVKRRSPQAVAVMRRDLELLRQDIERKRFPQSFRAAYNSPCDLCDYQRLCHNGDRRGLRIPPTVRLAA